MENDKKKEKLNANEGNFIGVWNLIVCLWNFIECKTERQSQWSESFRID